MISGISKSFISVQYILDIDLVDSVNNMQSVHVAFTSDPHEFVINLNSGIAEVGTFLRNTAMSLRYQLGCSELVHGLCNSRPMFLLL